MFLERDEGWVAKSRESVAEVEYDREAAITDVAIARRRAFDKASAGDFEAAATLLHEGIRSVTDDLEEGWLLGAGRLPLTLRSDWRSEGAREGTRVEPRRPQTWRLAVTEASERACRTSQVAAVFLKEKYDDPGVLRLNVGSLFENIVWGPAETTTGQRR